MPSRTRAWAGRRVMSRPSKRIVPASGRRRPQSRLTRVVLPAPFGPISAWISPRGEVEVDAVDRLAGRRSARVRPRASSRRHGSHGRRPGAQRAEEAARGEEDEGDAARAPTTRRVASVTRAARSSEVEHQRGADERPEHGAGAAEEHPEQRQDRILHRGEGGADVAEEEAVGGAGGAGVEAGEGEREEAGAERVVAEHPGALGVLAHGDEDAAGRASGRARGRRGGRAAKRAKATA